MIPYDIDPSLHDSKPEPRELEDGFSPPQATTQPVAPDPQAAEPVLSEKSPY